jgi:hypothetical protein
MRTAVTIGLHALSFGAVTVLAVVVLLYTAEDDTWYQPPYDGDAGDDDGYFLAVVRLLPYAMPLLGVAYIAGALVARTRHPARR